MQGSLEALRELWTGEEVEEPTTLDSMSQIWVRPEEMTNIMEMNMKKLKEDISIIMIRKPKRVHWK